MAVTSSLALSWYARARAAVPYPKGLACPPLCVPVADRSSRALAFSREGANGGEGAKIKIIGIGGTGEGESQRKGMVEGVGGTEARERSDEIRITYAFGLIKLELLTKTHARGTCARSRRVTPPRSL